MSVVYNEIDPVACAVLRHLSSENIIAPGLVVERSIKDIHDLDLIGVTQFHGFAGAGLWSVAARLAGWPDERPLWTASCPCQGESVAGKKLGKDDPRHLWPDFFRLVRSCRPAVVVGEQVDRAVGTHWLDGVWSDMESADYAFRAVDIPACSVNAPHRRNRIYWIAVDRRVEHAARDGRIEWRPEHELQRGWNPAAGADGAFALAHANGGGHRGRTEDAQRSAQRRDAAERITPCKRFSCCTYPDECDNPNLCCDRARVESLTADEWDERFDFPGGSLDDANTEGRLQPDRSVGTQRGWCSDTDARRADLGDASGAASGDVAQSERRRREGWDAKRRWTGAIDASNSEHLSFWSDAEWLACADGKARRSKPGVRLLVDGMAGRADLWRLAGNSIIPQLASQVLRALKDEIDDRTKM